ncbi:MAG: PAS domain S-box protein [Syntrophobacteraceae bacterium]
MTGTNVEENQLSLANTVEALQDSEKRYRRLFESAQDGILILDADTGKVVDVNPFLLQLLGYSHDAICGQYIWELGVFKDIAASKDAFKILQDNQYIRYEDLPLETLDRRPIAVEFVSNVYLVDHRKVIQCNIRDITARKRADQRLRDLAAIVESSDDAIISKTLEGRILTWNKAAERIYGYTAEEIVGQSVSILVPQDRPDELSEILAKLKSGETVTHYETVRVRKDGECIHVSLAISLLKDAKARVVGAATIARDITKRKRMEDELKKSHDELGILFRDLREKSENLEEVNIALKVLLKQRENDQKELAEMVLTNVRNLVLPYLGKLKRSQLSSAQSTLVEILELHLSEITSSFTKKLGIEAADLTPTQLRIAVLIRDGKSTSEIAEILCTSEKTIETHRGKIRKKLGLQGRRSNLMSHLQKI